MSFYVLHTPADLGLLLCHHISWKKILPYKPLLYTSKFLATNVKTDFLSFINVAEKSSKFKESIYSGSQVGLPLILLFTCM